jgi:hypothetical protein
MHLCHPDPRCLCHLRCRDHSSLAMVIPPLATAPFCHHCQPLSSHSCPCQPLLAFTAPIDGWLLHSSLLCHPLPAPLSVAPIIDTFFAGRHAVLFLICAILFLIAPLPPSTVIIHPATTLNLHPVVPLSFSGVVVSHPSWLVVESHLIMPPPPVCRRLCLLSRRCLLSSAMTGCGVSASTFPRATASHPTGPPPLFIHCLLLLPPTSSVPCC